MQHQKMAATGTAHLIAGNAVVPVICDHGVTIYKDLYSSHSAFFKHLL